MFPGFKPKFVKRFADLHPLIVEALHTYKAEVENGAFPSEEYTFAISEDVLKKLY
jgi:3-methyl-2-oxobutanoate hydroxymethyltransferase